MLVVIVAVMALIAVLMFSNEVGRKQRLSQLKAEIREAKKSFENYLLSVSETKLSDEGAFEMAEGLKKIYFAEHMYNAICDLNEDKEEKLNATKGAQLDLTKKVSKSLFEMLGGKQSDFNTLKMTSKNIGEEMNNEFTLLVHE